MRAVSCTVLEPNLEMVMMLVGYLWEIPLCVFHCSSLLGKSRRRTIKGSREREEAEMGKAREARRI